MLDATLVIFLQPSAIKPNTKFDAENNQELVMKSCNAGTMMQALKCDNSECKSKNSKCMNVS